LAWIVEFSDEAERDFRKFSKETQRRILKYINTRIKPADDPRVYAKPLKRELAGFWSFRIGEYRLICHIEDDRLVVWIIRIGHRSDVYESRQ
jgi:mRNA interferase RelE/StbE